MQNSAQKQAFQINTKLILWRSSLLLLAMFLSTGISYSQTKTENPKQTTSKTVKKKKTTSPSSKTSSKTSSKSESPSNKKSSTKSKSKTSAKSTSKKSSKSKSNYDFSFDFGMRTTYDDNILKYSDKYRQRFINREDEGRFNINTSDDVILRPAFKFEVSKRFIKKLRTEFDFYTNRSMYLNNDIKTWSYFSVGLRQYYSKRNSFKLSYNYIPDFYIRHFRDEDFTRILGYVPESFKPMAFSKESFGLWAHHNILKNTSIRISLEYKQYFYNSFYTEYDSKDYACEIKVYQSLPSNFRIQVGYSYTKSNAKGFDDPGETLESSDDADATFMDNSFTASINWKIPSVFGLKHSLTLDGEFGDRHFTTKNYLEIDPLHAGRVDNNYGFSLSYDVQITKSMDATLFYNFLKRETTSKAEVNREMISEEKNYNQNLIGVTLLYRFKF